MYVCAVYSVKMQWIKYRESLFGMFSCKQRRSNLKGSCSRPHCLHWGSNQRPLDLKSSTTSLSDCPTPPNERTHVHTRTHTFTYICVAEWTGLHFILWQTSLVFLAPRLKKVPGVKTASFKWRYVDVMTSQRLWLSVLIIVYLLGTCLIRTHY